jgi:hypothetical protein
MRDYRAFDILKPNDHRMGLHAKFSPRRFSLAGLSATRLNRIASRSYLIDLGARSYPKKPATFRIML